MMADNSSVTFEIESDSAFADRAREIARALDRGDSIAPQAHLSFPDMETLLTVLTPKRFSLLRTLRQTGPSSIRALAAALGRDYKAVHGDVTALIANGLIERQAADRIAVLWDSVHADFRLAA
jgi:predicted transcriptional regulator